MSDKIISIFTSYLQLEKLMSGSFAPQWQGRALTLPQLMVLSALDGQEPMQISQLASLVNNANSTISGIIDRLESIGLVKRTRGCDDRRIVYVQTSASFESLKIQLGGSVDSYLKGFFSQCSPEDLEVIQKGIELFINSLEGNK